MSCALSGSAGTCTPVPSGTAPTPATQCADAGARQLRNQRPLRRHRQVPALRQRHDQCVAATCSGDTLTPTRTCDGAGTCKTVTSTLCDPYACGRPTTLARRPAPVSTDCTSPPPARGPRSRCGKLAIGATCTTSATPAPRASARRQRLLQQRLRRHLHLLQPARARSGPAPRLPAGQAPDPTTQCTDQGAVDLRHERPLQRQRRLPEVPVGHSVRGRRPAHRQRALTGPSTCNTSNVCTAPSADELHALHLRHERLQDDLRHDRRLPLARHLCSAAPASPPVNRHGEDEERTAKPRRSSTSRSNSPTPERCRSRFRRSRSSTGTRGT